MSSIPADIKRRAAALKVTVRIGRNGITESVLTEISDQLGRNRLLKIKMNKGLIEASQRKEFWMNLAAEASAKLADQKGNVAVFWKP